MAQAETQTQRSARLRQEALAQFYANRAASVHERYNNTAQQGPALAAQQPAAAQADQRGWLQRLLDAMGGNPSGK